MDMYDNNGQYHYQFEQPEPPQKNAMSTASMVMGLLTVVTTIMCTVYIPFITCGLAILFAILSKGKSRSMSGSAVTGTITGIGGFILNILLIAMVWYMYTNVPDVHNQANEMFEQRYGVSIDELFEDMDDINIP